jgi:uncharacterized protein (TIGR00369 family)
VGEVLRAIQAGELTPPPAASLLGVHIVDVGNNTATFGLIPQRQHLNGTGGAVHGGFLATLADFALCSAVNDIPPSVAVATAGLHITYQRPVTLDTGEIRATATVLHRTARTATVEARITDLSDRLHAHATATCVITKAFGG